MDTVRGRVSGVTEEQRDCGFGSKRRDDYLRERLGGDGKGCTTRDQRVRRKDQELRGFEQGRSPGTVYEYGDRQRRG